MSWHNNEAIEVAQLLAEAYVLDMGITNEDTSEEIFEDFDLIACGTHYEDSSGNISADILAAAFDIAEDAAYLPKPKRFEIWRKVARVVEIVAPRAKIELAEH